MKPKKKGWGAWILISVVVVYMGILIIAPITALIKGTFQNGVGAIWQSITSTALLESLILSLKIALLVVLVQVIFGSLTAWVIVRQDFPGKSLLNSLIDIPFALSPVVVGYMLLLLFGRNGVFYPLLQALDLQIAFALPGMFLATLFVSLPFMVREMLPVISNLDRQQEFAAATLGANQWTIFWQVIFPQLKSALIYGISLTLARALGEFGAVLVIGGGVQGRTETATLFIFRSIEERQNIEAYIASILLGAFSVLIVSLADRFKNIHKKKQTIKSI
ncbi:MAG: sulfate ABC transporter permease subunit [Chloroflexota bacterium]|jgi:sulfate transport system permease protein|nr:sulfate ABC transporter permease subunit [Chloroflexota bacterium]